jgi:hypothetical protein
MHANFIRGFLLPAGASLLLATAGCHRPPDKTMAVATTAPGPAADRPLPAYQTQLLDLALATATAIPVIPHLKDRSRAQEAVVTACFELGQPQRALAGIEKIEDWGRGAGCADYAFYCARHGDPKEVPHYLQLANQIAEATEDWPRDCIRVKIAQTHAWLGQPRQAEQFEQGVDASQSGKVARVRAMRCDDAAFEAQTKALDGLVATGNFDRVRNALESYTQFFDRFYGDVKRRGQVEAKIKAAWRPLPVFIRVNLLMAMAGFALDHADQSQALLLVDEARRMLDGQALPLEEYIPLMATLTELRFRAGEVRKAHAEADALRARYDAEKTTIVDIYRAGTLRSLAEAYQTLGDRAAALAIYTQAVDAGVQNPNSRPRAEDLSATCVSMAVHAVRPEAELWTRMRAIRTALADPW